MSLRSKLVKFSRMPSRENKFKVIFTIKVPDSLFYKGSGIFIERIDFLRIDKFLKVSRIIKRRTVANQACDAGKILVNGKVTKASYDVKLDDIIEVKMGNNNLKVKVLNLNEAVKKENASNMYQVIQ